MGLALELTGLSKAYGPTKALQDVSFNVVEGQTHAIIGENGAGKSTLIRALAGLERPDRGSIRIQGRAYAPRNLKDSRRAGVSTAFQDLSLLPNLTVAENLFLPRLGRGLLVKRKDNEAAAREVLDKYRVGHISPNRTVDGLALADKQKLEIVRAISHQPKILLLDEPSAALPDVEWLYSLLADIRSSDLTILYISHRLAEIRDLCQTATVLRNGEVVDTVRVDEADDSRVFQMMGGATEGHGTEARQVRGVTGEPAIEVRNLSGQSIKDVNFTLQQGELLGVAALEGQGQGETFRILAGALKPAGGQVYVDDEAVTLNSTSAALRRGISFVAEERKTEGIFPGLSTLGNVTAGALRKVDRFGFLGGRREFASSVDVAREVDLNERYLRMDIDALSGGNQQKAVLARSLLQGSKYLLLYDPSRGVDVGTKGTIYGLMERFVNRGDHAVLWYSTDLAELSAVCDRILCFYRGSVVQELAGTDISVEALLAAITGHAGAEREAKA
ncbi:MAG: sugar ABC transporter ATP-binding protein [Nocardioides sp.]|nr:sugar ABC transporter ATP-binding protein [Nocardioides sp.]